VQEQSNSANKLLRKVVLETKRPENDKKEEKGASRHTMMASMMHICSGLVGPKAETLKSWWFLKVF